MKIRCRYCRETISLSHDSPAARNAGTDPHQQMRQHIATRHTLQDMSNHSRQMGWVIDMLFFDSPDEPQRWREAIGVTAGALITHGTPDWESRTHRGTHPYDAMHCDSQQCWCWHEEPNSPVGRPRWFS